MLFHLIFDYHYKLFLSRKCNINECNKENAGDAANGSRNRSFKYVLRYDDLVYCQPSARSHTYVHTGWSIWSDSGLGWLGFGEFPQLEGLQLHGVATQISVYATQLLEQRDHPVL